MHEKTSLALLVSYLAYAAYKTPTLADGAIVLVLGAFCAFCLYLKKTEAPDYSKRINDLEEKVKQDITRIAGEVGKFSAYVTKGQSSVNRGQAKSNDRFQF
jgi:F0F1-type ATP synthase membrane subunit b/b'